MRLCDIYCFIQKPVEVKRRRTAKWKQITLISQQKHTSYNKNGEKNTHEQEMAVFKDEKWLNSKAGPINLEKGNVGIKKLREQKLPKLLASFIKINLPALERDIQIKLDEATNVLKFIGVQP